MPHTIRTDRLLLRPLTLRDAPQLAWAFNDREVTKATKTWPWPVTVEHARFRIRQFIKSQGDGQFALGITYRGAVVGNIGGTWRGGPHLAIGYGLARPLWGQGLMTEAVAAFCGFGFRTLGAERIEADVFKDNPGSYTVLLKTGFRCIGDIGPGWSTTLGGHFPRWGYHLTRERRVRYVA